MSSHLFNFGETPGPFSAGLNIVEQYDYSRTYRPMMDEFGRPFRGERARPLQTLVWYPAEASSAAPMTVDDYVSLWATERDFSNPRMSARAREFRAGMAPTLAGSVWAIRDAPPVTGRFPVVIYAPGHSGPSWENADLCEYLATHGYVVLATPSIGATTRYPTIDVAGMQPQAQDIAFLIGYAHRLRNTLVSEIAVAGFSWGGICNLLAAARDNRIRALVCLDGSLRFSPGLVRKCGEIEPERMTIPLLSVAQGQWTPEEKAAGLDANPDHDGPDVLNAWTHGDLVTLHLSGFTHGEHCSMAQRNEDFWRQVFSLYPARKTDYGREDGATGYGWLCRYTLQFLNAYLKKEAGAMMFLRNSAAENGAARRFMTASYRAARSRPVSMDTFREEIYRLGFARAAEVYAALCKRSADFRLDEESTLAWAEELIDAACLPEAVALLRLNAQLNPDSDKAFAALGKACEEAGLVEAALESYQRASERGPPWLTAEVTRRSEALRERVRAAEAKR